MFRRRRRKARVTWMPQPGIDSLTSAPLNTNPLNNNSGFDIKFNTAPDSPQGFFAPLVLDQPTGTAIAGAPLTVLDSQGLNLAQQLSWRLRRIVGKLFISANFTVPDPQNDSPPEALLVAAGIIVRHVDETGQPTADTPGILVDTLANNPDPWIWRRDWIIANRNIDNFGTDGTVFPGRTGLRTFPQNNAQYGSVKDGPHIDQKTNRVIGPEERLFVHVTAWELPFVPTRNFTATVGATVYANMQYRVLGSIYTNSGNRRNASR